MLKAVSPASRWSAGASTTRTSSPSSKTAEELKQLIYRPYYNYLAGKDASTDPVVNPNYITPKNFMMRLVKCTDEYGGGVGTYYTTSKALLDTGFYLLGMMEEDSAKLAARDLHELLRCWENYHRLWTVRLHMQHIAFREESRYPGFYYRADFLGIDDSKWKCFVNSKYDPATGETKIFKKPTTRSSLTSRRKNIPGVAA